MGHGTVKMGEAGEGVDGFPFLEDFGRPRRGGGLIGVHGSNAERSYDLVAAEKINMAIVFGARFLAGADRVTGVFGFPCWAEGVLGRGIDLALKLQEVSDAKVFRLHPSEECFVVGGGSREMDVIVAGEPVFRRLVPAVKLD